MLIITCIVLVCRRDALVLFYPICTYSYVSSYFASYLGMHRGSLDILVYMSMTTEDYIIIDWVYRSYVITIDGQDMLVAHLLLDTVDLEVIISID